MTRFGFHASHEQIELGGLLRATQLYVHHIGQEQQGFLDVYAEKVLPAVGAT
jgi:hypothetical protein